MFPLAQLRKQWPAATTSLVALAFVLNHYRIAGLENVRLERRSPAEIAQRQASGETWSTSLLSDLNRLQFPTDSNFPSGGQSSFPANATQPFPSTQPNQSNQPSGFPNTGFPNTGFPGVPVAGVPVAGAPVTNGPALSSGSGFATGTALGASGIGEPDLGRLLSASEKFAIWENKSALASALSGSLSGATASSGGSAGSIRIASFHVPALGATKLSKPHVFEMLVRILRRFDIVALQGIQSNRDDILPLIVERLNQSGRNYDYMIGPRVGRTAPLEQFAYIFDTQRLETDRYQLYTVDDPDDLIAREPLVAWFRTRGHAANQAFTFSMINVHVDPVFAERERQLLPNLVGAVQNDGRGEDDWILLGDFAGGDAELFQLTKTGARLALIGVPTTVEGTYMLDEIAFSGPATVEFNGKVGVYDFLRQYNLSLEQALEVSDHLPIWAEFSTLEGAEPGRIAPVTGDIH